MKTKFILHGGMVSHESPHNDSFFKEITRGLEDSDKVLFVGFARRTEEEHTRVYERDRDLILAQTNKDIVVERATEENLIEQVKSAQAISVAGGSSEKLKKVLEKYPEFPEILKGKTYAGSSAGACITSTYYFGCTPAKVLKGLGWLPVRILVHYGNPEFNATNKALEKLKTYPDNLELITLPEYEWVVREVG